MAKPDVDDGWLKYAHELDAALAVADFTKGARIVLREVFAQIFGPAKRKTAVVSLAELSRCSGQVKPGLSRALRELVESGVLSKAADGSYAFHKDYESWKASTGRGTPSGAPRLSAEEVIYCRNAPARVRAYMAGYLATDGSGNGDGNGHGDGPENALSTVNPMVNASTKSVNHSVNAPDPTVNHSVNEIAQSGYQKLTIGLTVGSAPPDPPNKNGRGEFENGELRIGGGGDAPTTESEDANRQPDRTVVATATVSASAAAPADPVTINPTEPAFAIIGLDAAMEAMRTRHNEYAAEFLKAHAPEVAAEFGGRFEFYIAAFGRAKQYGEREPIGDVHKFCMSVARRLESAGAVLGTSQATGREPMHARPVLSATQERQRRLSDGIKKAAERIKAMDI